MAFIGRLSRGAEGPLLGTLTVCTWPPGVTHGRILIMIAIVDYQMGNLRSVQKALERVGATALITCQAEVIRQANGLVLPGVGAFGDAVLELRRRGLIEPLLDFIRSGRPFLGICLGLQLLFEKSFENGEHAGLGVLQGDVVRFPARPGLKVPHMGWNQVRQVRATPLLEGIEDGSYFYFVHSYYVRPRDPSVIVLETDYGEPFCAMVQTGNVWATQFHPEKSQRTGLRMLENFVRLVEKPAVAAQSGPSP
jgi:glutamine amidotransferase